MTRTVTIELPDSVVERTQDEASEKGKSVDEIVKSALVEHHGWRAIAEIRKANTDLDEESALKLAYEELDAYRAERDSS